jgi:N-acetyl-anhydromuramyl-L-alanine amidase AmpD
MPRIVLTPPLEHRSRNVAPSLLVLHATAGASARSSIRVLQDKGLSYHVIVARDGIDSKNSTQADASEPLVWHCVAEADEAFHVASRIPPPGGEGRINKASIGISLANLQNRSKPEPYPAAQLAMLETLIAELRGRLPSLRFLTTHAAVQPWNRSDPRELDGAAVAARHGLAFWRPTKAEIEAHRPPPPT